MSYVMTSAIQTEKICSPKRTQIYDVIISKIKTNVIAKGLV